MPEGNEPSASSGLVLAACAKSVVIAAEAEWTPEKAMPIRATNVKTANASGAWLRDLAILRLVGVADGASTTLRDALFRLVSVVKYFPSRNRNVRA